MPTNLGSLKSGRRAGDEDDIMLNWLEHIPYSSNYCIRYFEKHESCCCCVNILDIAEIESRWSFRKKFPMYERR